MAVHGIREFYSKAVKSQFLRDFNFRLMQINTDALALSSDEIIYATSNVLPARTITNHTVQFMGMNMNYAGVNQYDSSSSYSVKFFMDANGSMRQKLEKASRTIFNDTYSTGDYRVPGLDNVISLVLVDSKLEPMITYNLVGAQFRNIGAITMDYTTGDGKLVTCDCTIAYQWYTVSDSSDQVNVAK
jgi:hypothetical protein